MKFLPCLICLFASFSVYPLGALESEKPLPFCESSKCAAGVQNDCCPKVQQTCPDLCISDEWAYSVAVDWLYWKPFTEGYEWALANQQLIVGDDTTTIISREYVDQDPLALEFDFSSNWRVIGSADQFDTGRDITVKFAHIEDSKKGIKNSFGNLDTNLLGVQFYRNWTLGTDTKNAPGMCEAKQTVKYYVADIELGKQIWYRGPISMRMQIGVRGLNLRNQLKILFQESNGGNAPGYTYSGISDMVIKTQFEGAGVRLGSFFKFQLYKDFVWKNEVNVALALGRFSVKQTELYNSSIGIVIPQPDPGSAYGNFKQNMLKPNAQLISELGYAFTRPSYQISLKVGYEIDYWFAMNQSNRYTPIGNVVTSRGTLLYVRERGDVYFHGVYGEGGISF